MCVCVNSDASAGATCCAQIAFPGMLEQSCKCSAAATCCAEIAFRGMLEQSCKCRCNMLCSELFLRVGPVILLCDFCGCSTMAAADDPCGVAEAAWLEPKRELGHEDEDHEEEWGSEEWGHDAGGWYEDVHGTDAKMEDSSEKEHNWEQDVGSWNRGSSSENEGWWNGGGWKYQGYKKEYNYKTVKKDKWPKNYQQMNRSSSSDSQGSGRYVPNGFIRDGIFYPSLVAI